MFDIFGIEVDLEVVQERKKSKEITEDVVKESGGFISLDEKGDLSWNDNDFEK